MAMASWMCQAGCPTDLDNDGDTDFNDILIVLSNFGSDGSDGGDADDDGDVDFNDLITLLSYLVLPLMGCGPYGRER